MNLYSLIFIYNVQYTINIMITACKCNSVIVPINVSYFGLGFLTFYIQKYKWIDIDCYI